MLKSMQKKEQRCRAPAAQPESDDDDTDFLAVGGHSRADPDNSDGLDPAEVIMALQLRKRDIKVGPVIRKSRKSSLSSSSQHSVGKYGGGPKSRTKDCCFISFSER